MAEVKGKDNYDVTPSVGGTDVALVTHNHSGVYEPADATILKDADIGGTVQAYDANLGQIAAISPTKGNVLVGNGSAWVAVGVGANDEVLTADSAQAAGVKWAASGGGAILQVAHKNVTSVVQSNVTIDFAASISSTSGTAFDSHSITMIGNNAVRFQMTVGVDGNNDSGTASAFAHRGTTVLAAVTANTSRKELGNQLTFDFYDNPGTGTHTYSVRVFSETGATCSFNRVDKDATPWGGTIFVNNCNITLTEIG